MAYWSKTLVPSLRDDPQEAEIPSHRLMLRAGLMRRVGGGLYTFLPLGLRALRKVEAIVRQEMDRANALEVLMPALQPRELWDQSKRFEVLGPVMFKVHDRMDRIMVLGPTHEEVITDLVSREINSYRQLPKTFYQIQMKFRDEIRPRFGLMRAKEFIMKDAYSFDVGSDEADKSYQAMYNAYVRIFQRCGLRTKAVEADTGAMGGKWSHEFMVIADAGEDALVECEACSYAANVEKAERIAHPITVAQSTDMPSEVATPNARTIVEVAKFLKRPEQHLIKTLIYVADGAPVAALVPGDRDVNPMKLRRLLDAQTVELADDATIQKATGAPVGFAGPVGLSIKIVADASLKGVQGAVTGANKADTHLINVSIDRDASVAAFGDICVVRKGDACPRCGKPVVEKRGIEVGHVFKLGTKYTEAFGATYLDATGQAHPMVMGCYGIGVTRTLQSIIEQSHDKDGIIWPAAVAPYTVGMVILSQDAAIQSAADQLITQLEAAGLDVLVDDRDERAGVKFKDADLLGLPFRVVLSDRSMAKQSVEIKRRGTATAELVPITEAFDKLLGAYRAEISS